MVISSAYFAPRHESAGPWRSLRQFRRGSRSSVVPRGQTQPHQARPTASVRATVIRARADPAKRLRLASRWASVAKGSSRIGTLTSEPGQPPRRDQTKRAMNISRAAYWTSLRSAVQRRGVHHPLRPALAANSDLLDVQASQVAATQAHSGASLDVTQIVRLQAKQSGCVAVCGHDVGADDYGV